VAGHDVADARYTDEFAYRCGLICHDM
jgi:hypothetical protein